MKEEKIEKITVTLDSLAQSIATLSAETKQGFIDMEKRMDAKMDSKIDSRFEEFAVMVGHGFMDMGRRFSEIDRRFDAVDERFEKTDEKIAELRHEMKAEFAIVNGRLDRSEFRWKDHEQRITALEGAH